MTTITIKIDKRTKAGKAFMAMSESFFKGVEGIEIIENDEEKLTNTADTFDCLQEDKSPYNPEFVEMVLESSKRGSYKEVNPKDVWGSLGLK